jgi:hypothetical protein
MRNIDNGGSNPITDMAKNDNLQLQVIQLDVDKSISSGLLS